MLLYAVFSSMLLANLLYLVLGLGFAKVFARISLIPPQFLWPAVFVLSVIGAYAPNQAMAEVWVAIAFGFIGFFMRRYGFSPAPLVIGLVLGRMIEETLKQSLLIFDLSWGGFLGRPIAMTLFGLTALFLLVPWAAGSGFAPAHSLLHLAAHAHRGVVRVEGDVAPPHRLLRWEFRLRSFQPCASPRGRQPSFSESAAGIRRPTTV